MCARSSEPDAVGEGSECGNDSRLKRVGERKRRSARRILLLMQLYGKENLTTVFSRRSQGLHATAVKYSAPACGGVEFSAFFTLRAAAGPSTSPRSRQPLRSRASPSRRLGPRTADTALSLRQEGRSRLQFLSGCRKTEARAVRSTEAHTRSAFAKVSPRNTYAAGPGWNGVCERRCSNPQTRDPWLSARPCQSSRCAAP